MKSLATCLKRMIQEGYTEDFRMTDTGLESMNRQLIYQPEAVKVVNFFRFEGISGTDDNAVLYVIETNDSTKGTLIDACGIYSDPRIARFMKEVESAQKKVVKN